MNETDFKKKIKKCRYCGKIITGRADKIFCDDRCRNNYYYKVNREQKTYIRKINVILLRNHGILRTLNPYGRVTVSVKHLEKLGFDFCCYTGIYTTKKGKEYYLVYNQAYRVEEKKNVRLVVLYRNI